jgi:hypothetical protein
LPQPLRGASVSGKSIFAAELADRLRLAYVEIDALHWSLAPAEEFRTGPQPLTLRQRSSTFFAQLRQRAGLKQAQLPQGYKQHSREQFCWPPLSRSRGYGHHCLRL